MFVTMGHQGAWWPLLGTCEVEKFGMPRRKAWGTGHCVRVAACGRAGENSTRVCKWRDTPSLEMVLEESWRYGRQTQRRSYTVTVFSRAPANRGSRAHSPIPHVNRWNGRTKNCENSRWMSNTLLHTWQPLVVHYRSFPTSLNSIIITVVIYPGCRLPLPSSFFSSVCQSYQLLLSFSPSARDS